MTEKEYTLIQERLSKKLKKWPTQKEQIYNEAILAAKSIVKDICERRGDMT